MFNVKKAALAAIAGFALSFLLSIIATGKFGTALLRGVLFAVVFAAGAIAIDFLNNRFLNGEGGDFPSLTPDTTQRKAVAKTAGNLVSIVIDDASLTEEPSAPSFDVSSNGVLLKNLDSKEKKTPEKQQEKPEPEDAPPSVPKTAVPEKADEDVSSEVKTADGKKDDVKKTAKGESASRDKESKPAASNGSDKKTSSNTGQAKKEDNAPAQESETFKPMPLDTIAGEAKKAESAAERKHERLQQIDELPDFAALTSGAAAQRDEALISDSEFAEAEPDDEDNDEDNVSASPHREIPVDYDSETIASAIRTLLKRDE